MHTCNDDIGASFLIMNQFWNKDAAENSYQASFFHGLSDVLSEQDHFSALKNVHFGLLFNIINSILVNFRAFSGLRL